MNKAGRKKGTPNRRAIDPKAKTIQFERGLYQVQRHCDRFLRSRGQVDGNRYHNTFRYGSKDQDFKKLRREQREQERLDRMAEEMGQA